MNKTSISMLAGGLIFAVGLGIKLAHEYPGATTETTDMNTKIYIPSDDAHQNLMSARDLEWETIAEHYPQSTGIDDWRKLHDPKNWHEGFSAFETANSWEKSQPNLPPKIAALFYGPIELLAAIPEHKTPLPGGKTASQSDVLAFIRIKNRMCVVAAEGKKEEPFDKTIGEWLSNASAGKQTRLQYITNKLGLPHPPPDHIRYQLMHRAAAAVIEAERFNADCAAMIVQSFSPEHTWFEDFEEFLGLFEIRSVKKDKIYKTEKPGITLYFGWASP